MTPDIIGTIHNNDAEYDAEGNVTKSATAKAGFHVNFPEEVPEIEQYKVDPQPVTPYRIYAGGIQPAAYVFPDEATFRKHFPEPEELL